MVCCVNPLWVSDYLYNVMHTWKLVCSCSERIRYCCWSCTKRNIFHKFLIFKKRWDHYLLSYQNKMLFSWSPPREIWGSLSIERAVYINTVEKLMKAAVKSDNPDIKFSWFPTKTITSSPLNSQQPAVSLIGKVW